MPRLPNFVVIGVAKSGTTSLWAQLREHPEVSWVRAFERDPHARELAIELEIGASVAGGVGVRDVGGELSLPGEPEAQGVLHHRERVGHGLLHVEARASRPVGAESNRRAKATAVEEVESNR